MVGEVFCLLQGDGDELLVGGRVEMECVSLLQECVTYAHGLIDGVATDVEIDGVADVVGIVRGVAVAAHEGVELQCHGPAFGQKGTVALDV